jgi:hypothetical protein
MNQKSPMYPADSAKLASTPCVYPSRSCSGDCVNRRGQLQAGIRIAAPHTVGTYDAPNPMWLKQSANGGMTALRMNSYWPASLSSPPRHCPRGSPIRMDNKIDRLLEKDGPEKAQVAKATLDGTFSWRRLERSSVEMQCPCGRDLPMRPATSDIGVRPIAASQPVKTL